LKITRKRYNKDNDLVYYAKLYECEVHYHDEENYNYEESNEIFLNGHFYHDIYNYKVIVIDPYYMKKYVAFWE